MMNGQLFSPCVIARIRMWRTFLLGLQIDAKFHATQKWRCIYIYIYMYIYILKEDN